MLNTYEEIINFYGNLLSKFPNRKGITMADETLENGPVGTPEVANEPVKVEEPASAEPTAPSADEAPKE